MTRNEIINAAFKVWGRNYYRKTSLSQLACELKVSKPALYRHFVNKQALTSAMTERFLDDFAESIKADIDNAHTMESDDGISAIIGSISEFFGKNVYALIFSLMSFYDRNMDGFNIVEHLKTRGVDMTTLQQVISKKYEVKPSIIRLIFASLTFYMSHFHMTNDSLKKPPSAENIQKVKLMICDIVKYGLVLTAEKAASFKVPVFDNLEKLLDGMTLNTPEPFFKAVAEAVAEAGPWDVSLDMVAKRLGMSKSSLYGHFKNRKDMLRRLFITEFKRIIEFARRAISLSSNTAEQLYLGILSISVYLRSRPEILIAMDWIRTRKLNFGKPDKNLEIFRLFEDVEIEPLRNAGDDEKRRASHWIMFLLINILTHPESEFPAKETDKNVQNDCIRSLYNFIIFGLGGFVR